MSKTMICLVCFFAAFGLCATIASGQDNQIVNGEFDDDLNGWDPYGGAGFNLEVVQDAGLSGSNALMIDITDASAGAGFGNCLFPQPAHEVLAGNGRLLPEVIR